MSKQRREKISFRKKHNLSIIRKIEDISMGMIIIINYELSNLSSLRKDIAYMRQLDS